MIIPNQAIDHRAARGIKEDDPENQSSGFTVLLTHKPLLLLALAIFHLGNDAIVPLYGLAAVAGGQTNGPGFVATTIVVAQATMILRRSAPKRRSARDRRAFAGTGRIDLGPAAVITIQGMGASLSPALGGWFAQWIGYVSAARRLRADCGRHIGRIQVARKALIAARLE